MNIAGEAMVTARAAADACPGVLRLHTAADGQLARVRLPGGRLDPRALAALADAAVLGSDIVELTSRAGLQVRGLPQDAADTLAGVLARGGLLPSLAHDRVRNILAAPLAGRGPGAVAHVDGIVESLDRALCADASLSELSGRFLFALDDGSHTLPPLRADVELAAERDVFRLRLDGVETSLVVSAARAPEVALDAARGFLALRGDHEDGVWRVGELPGGARRLGQHLGLAVEACGGGTRGAEQVRGARRLGVHVQRDGLFAVAVLPPLARLDSVQLLRLAELARALACDVRVSPWRTLTFVDVPASAAAELLGDLEELGLVTSDASGWAGLSACAGLGACAHARTDVRAAAARRALLRGPVSPAEHWSGCERRCGEPATAGVRVVAGADWLTVAVGEQERTVATAAAALELLEHEGTQAPQAKAAV
jgi:precorrin-3B synthase